MTDSETLNCFLFPHMTLSANALRNLYTFLPRLSVLEITRRASIPEWAQDRVCGWSVLGGGELSARVGSCIEAYRTFGQVHGGPGGILGFLRQALDEIDEPRFRIQEVLRGKCPPNMGAGEKEIVQAALFLEIARELDEKELEIEVSYNRLNAIEQEFRDILGLEDEESERAETGLSPALASDVNGLLYMLPKRIESWFRMLWLQPVKSMPVFVACLPEVVDETLDMLRTGCERCGKDFSTAAYLLGSIPCLDGAGKKRFRSFIEAPGVSELLSSCRHDLENFIRSAARNEDEAQLHGRSLLLQGAFEELRRKCGSPEDDKLDLNLTVVKSASLADLPGFPGQTPGAEAGGWPPVFLSIAAGR